MKKINEFDVRGFEFEYDTLKQVLAPGAVVSMETKIKLFYLDRLTRVLDRIATQLEEKNGK